MKITIFGATGLLGKALMREWREDQVTGLGSKDADVRDPQQVENAVEETHPDCIVRTSWLFGTGGKCFPDTILKLASTRGQLDVVNDQRGSPTYAFDLTRAVIQLCRKGAEGIVHVTNRGECTWFEFAQAIVAGAGLNTAIHPTTTEKFPRPAQRPKYS